MPETCKYVISIFGLKYMQYMPGLLMWVSKICILFTQSPSVITSHSMRPICHIVICHRVVGRPLYHGTDDHLKWHAFQTYDVLYCILQTSVQCTTAGYYLVIIYLIINAGANWSIHEYLGSYPQTIFLKNDFYYE